MPAPFTLAANRYKVPVKDNLDILGITIPNDGNMSTAVDLRMHATTGSMMGSMDIWHNSYLSIKDKMSYYSTHKLPIFLYGSEVWPLNLTTLQAIKS